MSTNELREAAQRMTYAARIANRLAKWKGQRETKDAVAIAAEADAEIAALTATTNEAAAQAENYESAKDEARSIAMQFGLCGELVQSGLQCEKLAKLIAHVRATQPVQAQGEVVAWVNPANVASAAVSRKRGGPFDQHTWREQRSDYHSMPLYAHPAPAVDRGLSEVEWLRAEQAAAVMPLIGPLLDAWDGLPNDEKATIREDSGDLARAIEAIGRGMDGRSALAASAPSQAKPATPIKASTEWRGNSHLRWTALAASSTTAGERE